MTVLVLGATSEIAQEVVKHFAGAGHQLLLACRDPEQVGRFAEEMRRSGARATCAVPFEAEDFDRHRAFYDTLPWAPDIVLCAVGYFGDAQRARSDGREARRVLDVNFTGPVSILNVVADDFERRRGGSIIVISSVAGERGRQSNYVYGAAKAGLTTYLSGLRSRLRRSNVAVLTVKAGPVRTRMAAGQRLIPWLTASPARAGRDIFRAHTSRRDVVFTLWIWRYIMLAIRLLPEGVFKRLPPF